MKYIFLSRILNKVNKVNSKFYALFIRCVLFFYKSTIHSILRENVKHYLFILLTNHLIKKVSVDSRNGNVNF